MSQYSFKSTDGFESALLKLAQVVCDFIFERLKFVLDLIDNSARQFVLYCWPVYFLDHLLRNRVSQPLDHCHQSSVLGDLFVQLKFQLVYTVTWLFALSADQTDLRVTFAAIGHVSITSLVELMILLHFNVQSSAQKILQSQYRYWIFWFWILQAQDVTLCSVGLRAFRIGNIPVIRVLADTTVFTRITGACKRIGFCVLRILRLSLVTFAIGLFCNTILNIRDWPADWNSLSVFYFHDLVSFFTTAYFIFVIIRATSRRNI